ncbi:MAG TPA: hypothetical protein VE781_14775 [Kineosporiaceae bacterium]|nr:hypothetical protein [Kineosporiaceae bacterium]
MGNRITNRKAGTERSLKLSNGSTDVLLSVLLLSGSDLARSPWEVELVTWLAQHDQGVLGGGTVGFDLDAIAWDRDGFEDQHAFVLGIVDAAMRGHRWAVLPYDPPFVTEQLAQLRELLLEYSAAFVDSGKSWDRSPPRRHALCPRHAVHTDDEGCLLCHDGQ